MTRNKGKTYHLSVMIDSQEDEMLREMMRLFNVRKGKMVSLSIRIMYKILNQHRDEFEKIIKDKQKIKRFFARQGIELKDKDFLV